MLGQPGCWGAGMLMTDGSVCARLVDHVDVEPQPTVKTGPNNHRSAVIRRMCHQTPAKAEKAP
jgi:hypothetical protein